MPLNKLSLNIISELISKIEALYNLKIIPLKLPKGLNIFIIITLQFHIKWEMLSNKLCTENQEEHSVFNYFYDYALYEIK